jgi:hypothetical protein
LVQKSEIQLYASLVDTYREIKRLRDEMRSVLHVMRSQPYSKDIWIDILETALKKSEARVVIPAHILERFP